MKRYVTYICEKCDAQSWFAGSCPDTRCSGRTRAQQVILVKDLQQHVEETASVSTPIPAVFIRELYDSLMERTRPSA